MHSAVIITKRGKGYISSASGQYGGGHKGARCGLTPYEAAARAAQLMIEYGQGNQEGADLMAPPEVMELVPEHLRSIKGADPALYQKAQVKAAAFFFGRAQDTKSERWDFIQTHELDWEHGAEKLARGVLSLVGEFRTQEQDEALYAYDPDQSAYTKISGGDKMLSESDALDRLIPAMDAYLAESAESE